METVTSKIYHHDLCSVNLDSIDNFCEIYLDLLGDASTPPVVVRCHRDSISYLVDLPCSIVECLDEIQVNPITKIKYNYVDHSYDTIMHDGPIVYQTFQTNLNNPTFRSIIMFLRRCIRHHLDTPTELGEKYTNIVTNTSPKDVTTSLTRLFSAHDTSGQIIEKFQGFQPKPLVPLAFRCYQQQHNYYEPSISFVTYIHDVEMKKTNGYVYTHHLKADHHNDVYVLTSTIREIDVPQTIEDVILESNKKIDH